MSLYSPGQNPRLVHGWQYRTTIFWLDNQAGPETARGSIDSPGAPSVHAPLEAVIVVHRGQWVRHETRPHDFGHDDWLQWPGKVHGP